MKMLGENFPSLYSVGFVNSGYKYRSLTELTAVPGSGVEGLLNFLVDPGSVQASHWPIP